MNVHSGASWAAMAAAMLFALAVDPGGATAQVPATPGAATKPACAGLTEVDFASVPDAATHLTAARFVAAQDDVPAHCSVQGYVAPNVGFELKLPAENWNGKFAQIGCGGFCGVLFPGACDGVLARGYACLFTDMGHKSTALDAKWGYNNLQAELDFAYRATHVATLAGKAVTTEFYGRAASKAYFLGCSTGGRQGMVEAQRFPWDYDGIVSGAPVINETGDALALLWNVESTLGADRKSLLTPQHIQWLHRAAVARCDRDDGLVDGLIGDPRRCGFDPAEMICSASRDRECLTAQQAAAVKRIYGGPVNSRGDKLYTGGAMPGSELNWIGNYVPRDGGISTYERFMTDMFRFLSFYPDPGPGWTIRDFNWDSDYKRLDLMERLYSGSNPDLRRFRDAGGKLIIYQGWADQSVLPLNIVDYYDTATRTMGGPAAIEAFARLFMVPGMDHCTGGEGAHMIDYLSYLEDWVERGEAPQRLLAVRPKPQASKRLWWGQRTPDPADVEFSRPVYPYPIEARYRGKGDPTDADSFVPRGPR